LLAILLLFQVNILPRSCYSFKVTFLMFSKFTFLLFFMVALLLFFSIAFLLHFSIVFLLLQAQVLIVLFGHVLVAPSSHSSVVLLSCVLLLQLGFLLFMNNILLATHQHTMNSILLVIHQYTILLEPFHVAFGFLIFLFCILTLYLQVFQDGCSSCGLLMLLLFKFIHYFLPF
jgi:hypothetical protein